MPTPASPSGYLSAAFSSLGGADSASTSHFDALLTPHADHFKNLEKFFRTRSARIKIITKRPMVPAPGAYRKHSRPTTGHVSVP
jgi:hypothetical protein